MTQVGLYEGSLKRSLPEENTSSRFSGTEKTELNCIVLKREGSRSTLIPKEDATGPASSNPT